ncbi:12504_t:CDS:1 [Acaulospora colombiana]|uniref:12504_t:CDS:1 n=1 Tax=Acaulospora colombiana TaxID=27376 RepID=A0ACA9K5S3_9GLOM|nr:12504_t:CDS:1 [Acaulospora colombiana]
MAIFSAIGLGVRSLASNSAHRCKLSSQFGNIFMESIFLVIQTTKTPHHRNHARPLTVPPTNIPQQKKGHFEIERKFVFDVTKIPVLERNGGPIKFESVKFICTKSFTDIYYDVDGNDYPLTSQDIWLRQRDEKWQCKTPMDLVTSMDSYHELEDLNKISDYLGQVLVARNPSIPKDSQSFGLWLNEKFSLTPFCMIKTTRQSYLLDNKFTLDLDTADFGHNVGEIELVVHSKAEVGDAEIRIARLLRKHDWFFDTSGVVLGKLSAYIGRFNRKQWECMERSGVLKRKLYPESLEDVIKRVKL